MKTLQMLILFLVAALSNTGATAANLSFLNVSPVTVYEWVRPVSDAGETAFFGKVQEAGAQQALQPESESSFSMRNLWSLTEKAGPLRWPIFAVFVIGVFLVCFKLFELIADQHESREVENMDFRKMSHQQIVRKISGQRESMLARLHAIMLNVFQSHQAYADLHDEIANFVQFQQDRFDTFRRRVDFLSDTAGALGLLGTVWGIFTVFSQGLLDDQIILTGMGFALITTLLGIIVSIILNLSSTEVSSFFNRRLDRIAEKSDELRFRLMELVVPAEDTLMEPVPHGMAVPPMPELASRSSMDDFSPRVAPRGGHESTGVRGDREPALTKDDKTPVNKQRNTEAEPARPKGSRLTAHANNLVNPVLQQEVKPITQIEAVFEDRFSNSNYGDSAPAAVKKSIIDSVEENRQNPSELILVNPLREDTVGKMLKNLCFRLLDEEGAPIAGRPVEIQVTEGEGVINDGLKQVLLDTDNNGEVRFDWQLAIKSGKQAISAWVPGADAPNTRYTHGVVSKPGVPRKLKQFGNNQGGPAGEPLARPLKVQVLDEFENPIPEWPVAFTVEMGSGTFENEKTELKVKTNAAGEGIAHLRVGIEPGFNTVKAAVEGVVKELKFQAMSMA